MTRLKLSRIFLTSCIGPALAGCSLLSAPAEARAQVNAEQVLNIGRNVLSMEDYLLAIQYFNLAIKAKPYLADAYYLRGLAKLQLDDYEGAIADCSLALERNKFKTEAYKVRGFALQQLCRDSLALIDYNHGLDYNPEDKYFLFYKGVALTELKDYDAADSTFSRLIRRNPKFDDAFVARGRMNLQRGDSTAALDDFNRALNISRSQINAFLMKAELLARQGNWKEAADNMDEAIRLRPEETDFYINRAYIRYNDNDFYGAMADYNYALTLQPDNETALFNRALLRTEVKSLTAAAQDFSDVLAIDPDNFHAIFNRGLVNLEIGEYRKALDDFNTIIRRYPRFHTAYYALAECYRNLGNIQKMLDNVKKADQLVANYVADPKRNPLDRPAIAQGQTNTEGAVRTPEEEEEEFMQKFNQLVTTSAAGTQQLAFNDRIKGRVQDRDINVRPADAYTLSFFPPERSLRNLSNNFRNLETLNRRQYISRKIYLLSGDPTPSDSESLQATFAIEGEFSSAIESTDTPRPIDLLGRGVARIMLKNYDDAISDLTRAIEGSDDFTTALFARAYAYRRRSLSTKEGEGADMMARNDAMLAMRDLDAMLAIDPQTAYAWFNKGLIYYELNDYTSAIDSYNRALQIEPGLGEAYFNRGMAYMRQGNRKMAFADLSKAGELGVMQSYNILKRLK